MKLNKKEISLIKEYIKKIQSKKINETKKINSLLLANQLLNYLVDSGIISASKKTSTVIKNFKTKIDQYCE